MQTEIEKYLRVRSTQRTYFTTGVSDSIEELEITIPRTSTVTLTALFFFLSEKFP